MGEAEPGVDSQMISQYENATDTQDVTQSHHRVTKLTGQLTQLKAY